MLELERTFLVKEILDGLEGYTSKKIVDLYVENGTPHADLRIRKNAEKYEVTRKIPVEDGDHSKQIETTIVISEAEFESLASVRARKVEKTRYYYPYEGRMAEVDVFEGDLRGLVVADFEFADDAEKDSFTMPDFCLADITQEEFIAGGVLAGKTYADMATTLERFQYQPLYL